MTTRLDAPITIDLATPETEETLYDVAAERVRQVEKWGVQHRPAGTGQPGDALRATMLRQRTDRLAEEGTVTWRDILNEEVAEAYAETDPALLREELIQTAAVALSWAEDIDRAERVRAAAEGASIDAAIAAGRLPLRSPGATS